MERHADQAGYLDFVAGVTQPNGPNFVPESERIAVFDMDGTLIPGKPVFVGGNEGGRGDIAMMRWSKDRAGPSFQMLINHDDAEREFAYSEPDNYSLQAAAKYEFHVVSIKNDWKVIVAP